MQWPALVLMLILGAAVYTIQFAYLTMAFPNEMYSGLLTVAICVQEPFEHFPVHARTHAVLRTSHVRP